MQRREAEAQVFERRRHPPVGVVAGCMEFVETQPEEHAVAQRAVELHQRTLARTREVGAQRRRALERGLHLHHLPDIDERNGVGADHQRDRRVRRRTAADRERASALSGERDRVDRERAIHDFDVCRTPEVPRIA